jgi:hypothetical protein
MYDRGGKSQHLMAKPRTLQAGRRNFLHMQ